MLHICSEGEEWTQIVITVQRKDGAKDIKLDSPIIVKNQKFPSLEPPSGYRDGAGGSGDKGFKRLPSREKTCCFASANSFASARLKLRATVKSCDALLQNGSKALDCLLG